MQPSPSLSSLVLGYLNTVKNFLTDLPSDERKEVLDFLNEGFQDREPQGPTTTPPALDANGDTLEGYLEHVKILAEEVKNRVHIEFHHIGDDSDTGWAASEEQQERVYLAENIAFEEVTGDRWFIFEYLHPLILKFSETFYTPKLVDLGLDHDDIKKANVSQLACFCMLIDVLRAAYGEENLPYFSPSLS